MNTSKKDWSVKLDDALWAYRTSYKTPIEMSHPGLYLESLVISLLSLNIKLCGQSRSLIVISQLQRRNDYFS